MHGGCHFLTAFKERVGGQGKVFHRCLNVTGTWLFKTLPQSSQEPLLTLKKSDYVLLLKLSM